MNIETKVNIGDQVYTLRKISKVTCPLCSGTGKINLGHTAIFDAHSEEEAMKQLTDQIIDVITNNNIKTYNCPECGGSGTVKVEGQKKCEVVPAKVVAIQLTIGGENIPPVVMYSVKYESGNTRKLTDSQFYLTEEAANKQCFIANLDRVQMPLADIRIPHSFATTFPCNAKLNKRMDEWRRNRKFDTEIYVDSNNNLFDGYTAYLVYKMMGYETVPVVLWPSITNNKEENTDAVSV